MDDPEDNRITTFHEAFLLGLSYFCLGNSNMDYVHWISWEGFLGVVLSASSSPIFREMTRACNGQRVSCSFLVLLWG